MNLITDRTYADVLAGNEKGCYGAGDLNRVESAVGVLQALMPALDLHPGLTTKTDWAACDTFSTQEWPTESGMQRYLQNVQTVCTLCRVQTELPQSMNGLSWEKANAIEAALLEAERHIQGVMKNFNYSGFVFAGEENIL